MGLGTRSSVAGAVAETSLQQRYRAITDRRVLLLAVLAFALIASFLFDVATGPLPIPVLDLLAGIVDPDTLNASTRIIIWQVRLPYALMAVLVGAALGLSGVQTQTVLNNPLASPFTLGKTAAATLGAAVAIVFGADLLPDIAKTVALPASAFVFSLGASQLIQLLSRMYGAGASAVILFGIAMVFACDALLSAVQFLAESDAVTEIVFWTMGSLTRATWPKVALVAAATVLMLPFAIRAAWALTALRAGEDQAQSIGIPVGRLRMTVLLQVSFLAAVAIAFVGAIGFVGLVGPHIARMMFGEDHRFLLPGAMLASALILSLASIASKALVPGLILPVGIVTALVGVPLFMGLVLANRRSM